MTREEYKRAKKRWIMQPLVGIAVFILLMFIAGGVANAVMPAPEGMVAAAWQ